MDALAPDLAADLTKVATWMSDQGLGAGPLDDIGEITGGTQNIMVRFSREGRSGRRDYVFRRGPRHLRPVSNTVILRETRVLRALAGTDVPKIEDINRVGSFSGLMTQSNTKSGPDIAPPSGDLETARRFGKRIADITARFNKA